VTRCFGETKSLLNDGAKIKNTTLWLETQTLYQLCGQKNHNLKESGCLEVGKLEGVQKNIYNKG
jgi:hypothetical protein